MVIGVSDSIFNKVMDNVKEFLNKDTNVLDEASESKVIEFANELADEIKNEESATVSGLADRVSDLEKENETLKAQVETKKEVIKEDVKNAEKVDVTPKTDPNLIEAPAKELSTWDVLANQLNSAPQIKHKK